jgi:two-component system, sensor histidine kinase and response regulator
MRSESTPEPVLDLESAVARLGGDKELFADMIGYMLEDAPKLFEELRAAVDTGDATTVRMKAHALKGLLASCGGVRAVSVAQALEDAGHSRALGPTPALVQQLESELSQLATELAAYQH